MKRFSRPWLWRAASCLRHNAHVDSIGRTPDVNNATPQSRSEIYMELAADTLRQFGKVRFVAHGCSMVPSICPGDLLTICSVAPSRLAPGDVVLTSREGRFYIHRLLRTMREAN